METGRPISSLINSTRGYLLMLVERKTKFLRLCKPNKWAMVQLLRPYGALVHTITAGNDIEFAPHAYVVQLLEASIYFTSPYVSPQRGLSKHTNGLVRAYFQSGHASLKSATPLCAT